MRCDELKGIIGALVDGEAASARHREQALAHTKECLACRSELAAQLKVKSLLAKLPQEDAPAFLSTRIMAEIARRKQARTPLKQRLAYSGAVALALLLAGIGFGMMMPGTEMDGNGIYKNLDTQPTVTRYLHDSGLTPVSMEAQYGSFGDFVHQRHEDVRDSLRVQVELTPGLESAVRELKDGNGLYKELPKDEGKEEEGKEEK